MAFQLSSEALLKYILSSPLSKSLQNIVNVNTRGKTKKDSDQHSSQSGALIGSNEDLLTETLIRLPATSILRFKSVSKRWHYLLSHSRFTFRFDSLSKSPGLFAGNIYVPFDAETNRSTHPFRGLKHPFGGIRILQSCNGLLLCCTDTRIVESRGHLHLIMEPLHDTSSSLRLNVYEMLMDRSGWFVKYRVELDGLPGAYPEVVDPSGYKFGVVDLIIGENEEDTFMVLRIPGKMIRYNIHDQSFKQILSFPGWFEAHRYIETLSSF